MRSGSGSAIGLIALAAACTLPGIILHASGAHPSPVLSAVVYGVAVLGAAFLLAWATEAIQHDLPQALALTVLALIAILPEYAVDVSFAYKAAFDPANEAYAIANMTGANRLLIGFAWPLVVLLFYFARKQRGVALERRSNRSGLLCLGAATMYGLFISLRNGWHFGAEGFTFNAGGITIIDTIIFAAIFLVYVVLSARAPTEEPDLIGPAALLGGLPKNARRLACAGLMIYAAFAVLQVAEPFGEALVQAGKSVGIDEFLLVQYLAPLASEAPEFVIVSLWALRGQARMALGALVSSTVNQWTLLIGALPVAYSIGKGTISAIPVGERQVDEVFLTAAFSALAITLVLNMHLSVAEASGLAAIFAFTLIISSLHVIVGLVCFALAIVFFGVWVATGRKEIDSTSIETHDPVPVKTH